MPKPSAAKHPWMGLALIVMGMSSACNKGQTEPSDTASSKAAPALVQQALADAKGVAITPVEPAMPDVAIGKYTYKLSTAPLYGDQGLPHYYDINQGQISDCALLSTLTAFAFEAPAVLAQHIKLVGKDKNGNDVYSVRLYYPNPEANKAPLPIDIAVSAQVLVDASGKTFDNQGSPLWPTLVEKAFALLNDQRRIVGLDHPEFKGLQALQGGMKMPVALQAVTGKIPQSVYVNGGSPVAGIDTVAALYQKQTDKKIIATMDFDTDGGIDKLKSLAAAHNLPFDGTTATLPNGLKLSLETANPNGGMHLQLTPTMQVGFFPNHAYAAEGLFLDSPVPSVIIDNPWNLGDDDIIDTELGDSGFAMPLGDFMVFVREIAYVEVPAN